MESCFEGADALGANVPSHSRSRRDNCSLRRHVARSCRDPYLVSLALRRVLRSDARVRCEPAMAFTKPDRFPRRPVHHDRPWRGPMKTMPRRLLVAALVGCGGGGSSEPTQNALPTGITNIVGRTTYDGNTDDLLTAGLGKTGLG